jgi:hypothetical protein
MSDAGSGGRQLMTATLRGDGPLPVRRSELKDEIVASAAEAVLGP